MSQPPNTSDIMSLPTETPTYPFKNDGGDFNWNTGAATSRSVWLSREYDKYGQNPLIRDWIATFLLIVQSSKGFPAARDLFFDPKVTRFKLRGEVAQADEKRIGYAIKRINNRVASGIYENEKWTDVICCKLSERNAPLEFWNHSPGIWNQSRWSAAAVIDPLTEEEFEGLGSEPYKMPDEEKLNATQRDLLQHKTEFIWDQMYLQAECRCGSLLH
ncbi:hypothetical protein BKA63DRAFT_601918 [Paraphoma chrysanthemicola]|nr:hypothetical protein BKA63DRAFT_601918 [Paraphoma chrysanthemicola]